MQAMTVWAVQFALFSEDSIYVEDSSMQNVDDDLAFGVDGAWRIMFHFTEDTLHEGQGPHIQLSVVNQGNVAYYDVPDEGLSSP